MSKNFFNVYLRRAGRHQWLKVAAIAAWVFGGFLAAQLVFIAIIMASARLGFSFDGINQSLFSFLMAAVVYIFSLLIIIGLPWLVIKDKTTWAELGLNRMPSWFDIVLAPVGMAVYLLLAGAGIYIASQIIPGFNINQAQDVGFSKLSGQSEYLLAFITLIVIAPVLEEILLRGYFYGKLRKTTSVWAAAIITSLIFGLLHGQWNVGIDVFALSLVLCALRELTGSIWAGIVLHMLKNGLAFYIIFINPVFLTTIGG